VKQTIKEQGLNRLHSQFHFSNRTPNTWLNG